MPVESPIDDLSSLNELWPLGEDLQETADDQLRLIKDAAKKQFSDISTNGGVVTASATELNHTVGATSNLQQQINVLGATWRRVTAATDSLNEIDRVIAFPPSGGTVFTLPTPVIDGVEVQILDGGGAAGGGDNTITVNRSGADTIRDLDTNTGGLVTFSFTINVQYQAFIYQSATNEWLTFQYKGL